MNEIDVNEFLNSKDITELEDDIIASGDAFYMYHFTHDVPGVNIQKMEDAIIESGNACYIYLFARNIEGADISKLEDAIIQTGSLEYMYYFAMHVDCQDIQKLKYEIAKVIKKERVVRASYFSLDEIVSDEDFSMACKGTIEYNRQKPRGKQKTKYHHWV